jgi:hypothetical protein
MPADTSARARAERAVQERAQTLVVGGKLAAAVKLLDGYLAKSDGDWGLWLYFAGLCARTGQRDEAVAAYRASSRQLEGDGFYARARAALVCAVKLTPRDADLVRELERVGRLALLPREKLKPRGPQPSAELPPSPSPARVPQRSAELTMLPSPPPPPSPARVPQRSAELTMMLPPPPPPSPARRPQPSAELTMLLPPPPPPPSPARRPQPSAESTMLLPPLPSPARGPAKRVDPFAMLAPVGSPSVVVSSLRSDPFAALAPPAHPDPFALVSPEVENPMARAHKVTRSGRPLRVSSAAARPPDPARHVTSVLPGRKGARRAAPTVEFQTDPHCAIFDILDAERTGL